jgi:dTDP-glucose pyrophosphorylase/CBS domain-containing protein
MSQIADLCVAPTALMRDVIACIDRNSVGIALVVDQQTRLIGTVTDGDVRRALLAGQQLDATTARELLDGKSPAAPPTPLTAPVGTSRAELLELLNRHDLRHIPLVDAEGRVAGIELLSSLVHDYELPIRALVMAGGYGTRLRPLTDDRPKTMLPVGGRPLLERIVGQLKTAGIRRVNVATHYRADVIEEHFRDGRDFGVEISYVNENQPLGTAGALALLGESNDPLLVMNGDIVTHANIAAMLDFHRGQNADMTVAVRPYEYQVPFGVLSTSGVEVRAIDEKPVIQHLVSAGIYLLNGSLCRLVPPGRPYDMTDLIARVLQEKLRVVSFPLREYWLDIGQAEDYARAAADEARGKDEA